MELIWLVEDDDDDDEQGNVMEIKRDMMSKSFRVRPWSSSEPIAAATEEREIFALSFLFYSYFFLVGIIKLEMFTTF